MSNEDARLIGYQRGGSANEQFRFLRSNSEQELLAAQGVPPYTEMTRRGLGWQVMNTSALAALVVRPSTVANLTLYNGETGATAKSYVIDRVFAFNLVSTAAQARSGIWLCSHVTMTAPTADITAIKSTNGKGIYSGAAIVDTGATVVDNGWFPWGTWGDVEPTGVLPGGILTVDVAGRIVVPPGAGLSIQVVSSVVGNTFTTGFHWYEVELDND